MSKTHDAESQVQLVHYDSARAALEKAYSVDEVLSIRNQAEAARAYARQAKDTEMEMWAAEIRFRAEARAGELLATIEKAKGGAEKGVGRRGKNAVASGNRIPTLDQLGISKSQSSRWQQLGAIPEPEREKYLEARRKTGKPATSRDLRRGLTKPIVRAERVAAQPWPEGRFGLIYADPPWRYEHQQATNREIERQYPTMAEGDIGALPVQDIAAENCVLYLWATPPKLVEALTVMGAWGFEYRTNQVWVKDKVGMGYWCRQRHEHLLIGVVGSPVTPAESERPDSVITAPRQRHSQKPIQVIEMLDALYPAEIPRVELFSRDPRDGWSRWGNE